MSYPDVKVGTSADTSSLQICLYFSNDEAKNNAKYKNEKYPNVTHSKHYVFEKFKSSNNLVR